MLLFAKWLDIESKRISQLLFYKKSTLQCIQQTFWNCNKKTCFLGSRIFKIDPMKVVLSSLLQVIVKIFQRFQKVVFDIISCFEEHI